MEKPNSHDIRDLNRWLINNGLVNDMAKDNLYLFGAILHIDIMHVELAIDMNTKCVSYTLYTTPSLKKTWNLFNHLREQDDRLSLWRLRRILKKHGNLDFYIMLSSMVKDFCGSNWNTKLKIKLDKEFNSSTRDEIDDRVAEGQEGHRRTDG